MADYKVTTREERQSWNIDNYIELLDKLYDLKNDLHEDVWNQLLVSIRGEIIMKFNEDERRINDLEF